MGDKVNSSFPNFLPEQMFLTIVHEVNDDLALWTENHSLGFSNVVQHLPSTPDTAISKIICFGLGSLRSTRAHDTKAPSRSNPTSLEVIKRAVLRHLVALQLGSLSSPKRDGGRQPEPLQVIFCDTEYTAMDRKLFEFTKPFGGHFSIEVVNDVDSALQQVDGQSFVLAPTSNFAVRDRILSCGSDVAGMLWTDHVYDDMVNDSKDKLQGDSRSLLKKKYRRYPFSQTFDGLRPEDIGVKLALYFARDRIPDPMVKEWEARSTTTEVNQEITNRANELISLYASPRCTSASLASPHTICQEFLKVLGRTEVEQPAMCSRICACAQFWRYQHYLLPLWSWGIKMIVCFGLGSFRNVKDNGGPFDRTDPESTYREGIGNPTLVSEFNAREVDSHDALQAMLRHVAAIEMASMVKFCSSKRGVEHQLLKEYFKKLTIIQDMPGSLEDISEKDVKKLEKLPPTAGYGGDKDFIDIPIYFHDPDYTEQDRDALARLSEVFEMAHLPPIKVIDAAQQEGYRLVDEHTLVYAVDPDFPVRSIILGGAKQPAAMIWRDHGIKPEIGDVITDDVCPLLDNYEEFKLDKQAAPHTIGSSHMYIRKDIVEAAEANGVVPPYPVTFPHDYPFKHENWYLGKMKGTNDRKGKSKCLN